MASQGLWINLLRLMFQSERPGFLQINGKPMTTLQIAKRTGFDRRSIEKKLAVLIANKVCSVDENGVLYSRRMVREIEARLKKNCNKDTSAPQDRSKVDANTQQTGCNSATSLQKKIPENRQKTQNPLYTDTDTDTDIEEEKKERLKKKDFSSAEDTIPPDPAPGKTKKPKSDPRGTLLPKDWQPDAEDRDYAIKLGLNPQITALKFFNHWTGEATGAKARKVSWKKSWQNWCLRAVEFSQGRNSYTPPMSNRERIGQKLDEMGKIIHLHQRAGQAQNTPNTQAYDPFENDEETLRLAFGE